MAAGERDPASSWGLVLREQRVRSGLSQSELARRAGVRPHTICRYESGQMDVSGAALDRLMPVLGLRVVADPETERREDRMDGRGAGT